MRNDDVLTDGSSPAPKSHPPGRAPATVFADFNLTLIRGRYHYDCKIRDRKCLVKVLSTRGKEIGNGRLFLRDGERQSNFNVVDRGVVLEPGLVAGVEELFVERRYRRKGIGTEIARIMLQTAKLWGVPACYLRAYWHEETSGFWAKLGFASVLVNANGHHNMRLAICPGAFLPLDHCCEGEPSCKGLGSFDQIEMPTLTAFPDIP